MVETFISFLYFVYFHHYSLSIIVLVVVDVEVGMNWSPLLEDDLDNCEHLGELGRHQQQGMEYQRKRSSSRRSTGIHQWRRWPTIQHWCIPISESGTFLINIFDKTGMYPFIERLLFSRKLCSQKNWVVILRKDCDQKMQKKIEFNRNYHKKIFCNNFDVKTSQCELFFLRTGIPKKIFFHQHLQSIFFLPHHSHFGQKRKTERNCFILTGGSTSSSTLLVKVC